MILCSPSSFWKNPSLDSWLTSAFLAASFKSILVAKGSIQGSNKYASTAGPVRAGNCVLSVSSPVADLRGCVIFGTGKRPCGTLSNYPASVRVRLRIRLAGVPAMPLARLQVGKCDMPTIEEHGGYFCAGCKQSWFSLCSLTHHKASPTMCGTDCERGNSNRELRNVHHSRLATGLEFRLHIIPAGTNTLPCNLNMCCMMCVIQKCRKRILLLVNSSHHCSITKVTWVSNGK
jgi:hypothetical protein